VNRLIRTTALLAAIVFFCDRDIAFAQQAECTPSGSLARLSGLTEASGLAVSKRVPGRLWTHNDSGKPVLTALDQQGGNTTQVAVTGAAVEDWEAIAVGPCAGGSCVYIGDIGDNEGKRARITIYRAPEPEASSRSMAAQAFHATYPDGGHDAETLLVANGRLYVVTKGDTGPVAIYRFPAELQSGATMKLEKVVELSAKPGQAARITDGSVSPDGQWVALRTKTALTFYPAAVLAGASKAAKTVDLTALKEPQGEGVALGSDNVVFLAGEGGGKAQPGTFVRFTCVLPGRS
jgi:hypothetical protein